MTLLLFWCHRTDKYQCIIYFLEIDSDKGIRRNLVSFQLLLIWLASQTTSFLHEDTSWATQNMKLADKTIKGKECKISFMIKNQSAYSIQRKMCYFLEQSLPTNLKKRSLVIDKGYCSSSLKFGICQRNR